MVMYKMPSADPPDYDDPKVKNLIKDIDEIVAANKKKEADMKRKEQRTLDYKLDYKLRNRII